MSAVIFGKIILLIDDSKFMLHVCKSILEKQGAVCMLAMDGEEALSKLREMRQLPDLILCDVLMPKMNGFEFHQKLQEDDHVRNIPFLYLSANDLDNSSIQESEYIKKPFTEDEFIAKITAVLRLC